MPLDPARVRELAEFLKLDISNTARWRREQAIEYPDDKRNLEAAAILERLADTVEQVDPDLLDVCASLSTDLPAAETESDMLRTVGFHWQPHDATEFIREFIARVNEIARESEERSQWRAILPISPS